MQASKTGRHEEVRAFFEKMSDSLHDRKEWKDWFGESLSLTLRPFLRVCVSCKTVSVCCSSAVHQEPRPAPNVQTLLQQGVAGHLPDHPPQLLQHPLHLNPYPPPLPTLPLTLSVTCIILHFCVYILCLTLVSGVYTCDIFQSPLKYWSLQTASASFHCTVIYTIRPMHYCADSTVGRTLTLPTSASSAELRGRAPEDAGPLHGESPPSQPAGRDETCVH